MKLTVRHKQFDHKALNGSQVSLISHCPERGTAVKPVLLFRQALTIEPIWVKVRFDDSHCFETPITSIRRAVSWLHFYTLATARSTWTFCRASPGN